MLYKYKEAFNLRDVIGTCPSIEVEIDVTGRSPFFIRPYHVKEEDKTLIDKRNETFLLPRCIKREILAYSCPIMLISRKLTQGKGVVTDFRHLNMRIVKNNLAHPVLKYTISVLGSSKYKALLVLDLKDTFHSLRLSKTLQNAPLLW